MKRVVIPAILLTALALAAPAGAVNLPKSQSQVASAQIVDGTLVWFQRNDRVRHKKHGGRLITSGVGAIYARPLDSKQVTRVYMPPAGNRIVDFKAGAGRITIGLATVAKEDRGPSSVVELTPGSPTWTTTTLATETDADTAGCGARVRLVGIRSNGEVLAERTNLTGRDGKCLPVRQESNLIAFDISGTESPVGKRVSGWASAVKWNLLPALLPTNNTYLLQQLIGEGGRVYAGTLWNPSLDEYSTAPAAAPGGDLMQVFDGGKVLVRAGSFEAGVIDATKSPATYWSTIDNHYNDSIWYRACGSNLLEIKRSWFLPEAKWHLKLRNSDGEAVRSLEDKLPHGTAFDACDQNTAVFHRPRHDGGIRQWAVDLSP